MVGSNKSDPEFSVKSQEEILKHYSKKIGLKVEKTFIDIGYSGIGLIDHNLNKRLSIFKLIK